MSFYVVFQKELDHGKLLPRFMILAEPLNYTHRIYKLDPGDCIDAAQVVFGDDTMTWTRIDLYRISNIEGYSDVKLVETYTMPYVR